MHIGSAMRLGLVSIGLFGALACAGQQAAPPTTAPSARCAAPPAAPSAVGNSAPAEFSLGESGDPACTGYATGVTPFFTALQQEYAQLQADADTRGADAFDRFGLFLKQGARELRNIETDGSALAAANANLVAGIDRMGDGFIHLAAAVRASDEAAAQQAADSLQVSTTQVADAFTQLKAACPPETAPAPHQ